MNEATSTPGASEEAAANMTKRLRAECLASNSNRLETIELENGEYDITNGISNEDTNNKTNKKPHRLTQAKIRQDNRLKCIK
eukprot:2168015-Ditylum_brightwellii.AAC.1